jgi:tRNA 2-thiouridine synthesizing protein A
MSNEVSAFPLDARGLACPMPIVLLARALKQHPLVELTADDPAAHADLLAFAEGTGHEVVKLSHAGRVLTALVRRKS